MKKKHQFIAIEAFAGGGGLAVGLHNAGFDLRAAIESDPHAAMTFKANHPQVQILQQDIREISGKKLLKLASGCVDILAACPPCQGFSSLTAKYKTTDPRNELVSEVARLTKEIKPRAIMMENVPGLAKRGKRLLDELVSELENNGYKANFAILQVADYGVPQLRKRLVLLAGLGFEIGMPPATHSQHGDSDLPRWRTVRETLCQMQEPLTLPEANRQGGAQKFDWHVVRKLSPQNQARLKIVKPGKNRSDIPDALRPRCHRGDYKGFPNVYTRMQWDEPAGTITAGCTTISKGRYGHPEKDRTISLREAALLQTFPADYVFDTPHMEHACNIVGNALPCLFAEAVARQVYLALAARTNL